ncbi:MAG: Ig-like domain-containing protein [Pseudomonadota bacterium]
MPTAFAGAYVFAEGNNENSVAHASGYNGTGGALNVQVCIAPTSPNAAAMEIPVRNAITRFNLLVPTIGNVRLGGDNEIAPGEIDFESVFTHELGHCLGLAHPNLASESGLSGSDRNYTKSRRGGNNAYDLGIGADGVRGSADDQRNDDLNLHWFFTGVNNPFQLPATPEAGTFSRDLADLPAGDTYAVNADRTVATAVYGLPITEAVMQQGSFSDEDQNALSADDVATLQHARAGVDRTAGTADDYTVNLTYGGLATGCDINVAFDNGETGFAVCKLSGTTVSGNTNWRITAANTFYNTGSNWVFSNRLIPVPGVDSVNVSFGGSTGTLNGGGTSLLTNDADPEGDGLVMNTGTFFGPSAGNVTLNPDGTFNYTHDGVSAGDDLFVYRVCTDDGAGGETNTCAHQYVNVNVGSSGNTPPSAADDAATVNRGDSVTVLDSGQTRLLANDSDADGDALTIDTTPVSGPSNGTLTINPNSTFSYEHDNSLNSADSFVYRVCDDGTPSECATATVTITVDLGDIVCEAPGVAIPDGGASTLTRTLNVASGQPLADLNVQLMIAHTWVGDLTATLEHDDTGTTVSLLDRPGLPAVNPNFGCGEDNINVTLDDEAGSAAEDQCDAGGTAINGTFTPSGSLSDFDQENFAGDWTLRIVDNVGQDIGSLTSWCLEPTLTGGSPTATNDGPGGDFTVNEGGVVDLLASQLSANDSDAEDGTPPGGVVSIRGGATNGTVNDNGDQSFTFTHDGSETAAATFQYQITDNDGNPSNTAVVILTVVPQNDPPVAVDDGPGGAFVVMQGASVTLAAASLRANDSDAEDGVPGGAVVLTGTAANGSVADNGDQTFTFTHDDSSAASASFEYRVNDSDGTVSAPAQVRLTVIPGNVGSGTAAACGPGGRRVQVGVPVSIAMAGEFSGSGLSFSADGLPASLSIDDGSGVISGTPEMSDLSGSPYDVTITAGTQTLSFVITVDATNDVQFYSSFEDTCIGL